MRRLLVIVPVLLALSAGAQASAPTSARLSVAAGMQPVLATSGSGPTSRLFFADPVSLRPLGRKSLRLGFNWGGFARSPDGSLLALSRNDGPEVRFVRLPRLRSAGAMKFSGEVVDPVAWPSARLLLALLSSPTRALAIDPISRRVLWERAIDGVVLSVESSASGLVCLVAPEGGTGPARIEAIGADGSIRSIVLERVLAGSHHDETSDAFLGEGRWPGLAVDEIGNRAYIVGAGEPIAQVDLSSMSVTYHGGSRTPAKFLNGPQRTATWLGNGLLAVTGTDPRAWTDAQGREQETVTPAGLIVVDTRTWSQRMLQPDATTVVTAGASLLAFGAGWDSSTDTRSGSGLTVYGLDGTPRLHLFGRTSVDAWTQGGLAYVSLHDRDGHMVVVDVDGGRILSSVTRPLTVLLLTP